MKFTLRQKTAMWGGYLMALYRRKKSEVAAVLGLRHRPEFSFYMYHALVRRVGVDGAAVIVRDSMNIRMKEADPEKVREITVQYQQANSVIETVQPLGEC